MPERTDVRATFDRIAAHFGATRPEPWPEVERFLDGRTGHVGLDLGTGNGRHAEVLAARTDRVLAVDLSRVALDGAVGRAAEREYSLAPLQADVAELPVRSSTVDLAVYIATIHHLPSRALRVRSLDELARVLHPEGTAIVSAWSVSHDRFDSDTAIDTTIDWTLPDGEVVERYYHIYDIADFVRDIEASELTRQDSFEAAGNCYAVVTAPERNAHNPTAGNRM